MKTGYGCCAQCGAENKKITLQNKYGVDCVFKSKKLMEKMVERRALTWIKKYGVDHPMKCPETVAKAKATCMERYGVDSYSKHPDYLAKYTKTCREKYGVDHPMKLPETVAKGKATCMERYGVDSYFKHPEFLAKRIKTCREKYGVDYVIQNPEILAKRVATWMEKYGVDHPMKTPEIFDKAMKNAFKYKEYTFPSGNTTFYQGYENFCLDDLLNEYEEDEIHNLRVDVPTFGYIFEGKEHVYYPDIYLPGEHKIIEVKSDYTYNKDKEKNTTKGLACVEEGYEFEIRIYSPKGDLIETITF